MPSHKEDETPFVDKVAEQEEHEGARVISLYPSHDNSPSKFEAPVSRLSLDQHFKELSDSGSQPHVGHAMTDQPSRQEIDARLEAAEARTEARFAQLTGTLDVRFANLDNKIDRLVDSVGHLSVEVSSVRTDNRATRWTIVAIVVASVLAGLAAIWITQGNMLAAFQASLAVKTMQSAPSKP